jgi:regulator of sigma E protease
VTRGDSRDFTSRPRWQRFLVYVAGPVMNGVLTVSVLTLLYTRGLPVEASIFDRPIVGAVTDGSPAASAGIQPGDEIVSIDGKPMPSWEDAQYAILVRPDTQVRLTVRRGGQEREVTLRSSSTSTEKVGTIGVSPLVRVGEVVAGQPAQKAGLQLNDAILRINGQPIHLFNDIPPLVARFGTGGRALTLQIYRDGRVIEIPVTPRDEGAGLRIGVGPKQVVKKFALPRAVTEAFDWTWDMTKQTFDVLGRLLTARISPRTMMGPLGIAGAAGDAARGGPVAFFYLVAVISLQVGIMNLFPLPPLDGGHLAILAGEGIRRRDFSTNAKIWIMNAGAMVLFLLIGLVLYSDLSKTSWLGKYLP